MNIKVLGLALICLVASCQRFGDSKREGEDRTLQKTVPNVADTVNIQLFDHYSINWSNKESRFVRDSIYYSNLKDHSQYRAELIEQIDNTDLTAAKECSTKRWLTKGELAFLLVDEFEGIPLFVIFHIQFDLIDSCGIVGLVDFVAENRMLVEEKLKSYTGDDE